VHVVAAAGVVAVDLAAAAIASRVALRSKAMTALALHGRAQLAGNAANVVENAVIAKANARVAPPALASNPLSYFKNPLAKRTADGFSF